MPMLRDDGGGGSAEAVSSDGLIYPEAFWGKSRDLDTEAIRTSAANLRALGADVSLKTDDISTVWNELPASYVSPEAWRVYTLMGPAVSRADGIEDRFGQGAGHLETFADELDAIKPLLADLERRANKFRAEVIHGVEVKVLEEYPMAAAGYGAHGGGGEMPTEMREATDTIPWNEHTETVAKNKRLLGEYFDLVEQITMSSDTCARAIRRVINPLQCTAPGEGTIGVITAEQLEAAGDLPFGAPVDEDRNCGESVGDGIVDFGKGIGEGAGMLLFGYNPETGDWFDGGAYGQAWGGLGNLVGSLAVIGPGTVLAATLAPDSAVGQWAKDRNDVVAGAAGSLVGYDHATAEAGGDGWHQWKEDGVATATTSVLNIGTFFIPGAGAIGGGAKAGSIAAKVGSAASVAAEVIVPGGSWLLKGGANAVRFGETAVTVARGGTAAVVDASRLGKAGVLTSLDDVTRGAGYTPTRPKLTDSFNLDNITKPNPTTPGGLHIDAPGNRAPHDGYDGLSKPTPEVNRPVPASRVPEGPSLPRTGPTGTPALGIQRVPPPHASAPGQPTPSHSGTEASRAVDAEVREAFGENPYELPDYYPEQWNATHGSHAEAPAPERVPALVGAAELEAGVGRVDLTGPGQVTNSIDTTPVGSHLNDGGHIDTGGNGTRPGSGGTGESTIDAGGGSGSGHGGGSGHLPEEPGVPTDDGHPGSPDGASDNSTGSDQTNDPVAATRGTPPPKAPITQAEYDTYVAKLGTRGASYGSPAAQHFQQQVTGSPIEYSIRSGNIDIWADGLKYDPQSGGAVLEAKFIERPGGSSIYEGTAPEFVMRKPMADFEDEIRRYAQVIADSTNPLSRLEVVTSTEAARVFVSGKMVEFATRIQNELGIVLNYTVRVGP